MLEIKSIAALAYKETTPRKRKRDASTTIDTKPAEIDANVQLQVNTGAATVPCFTNDAFSSTPKKLIGRRRIIKENNIQNAPCHYLETKSIGESVNPVNPFEVVRVAKKKKKHEIACFENEGLNLQLPEKQFNPYEVIRTAATPSKCFVNKGLNLRGEITPASLNPYEIQRQTEVSMPASIPNGIENPALVEESLSTSLKIGLPFVPTVGCRIDFNRLSITQSMHAAGKLGVSGISPVEVPKRALGSITEETTIDIGKELDRYQLELENSINEAKMRKNGNTDGDEANSNILMPVQSTKLSNEEPETADADVKQSFDANADVAYASDSEDENELDFKTPGNFVRAYCPAVGKNIQLKADENESLNSSDKKSIKLTEGTTNNSGIVVHELIRKSFRKLMHPMQTHKVPKNALQEKSHHNIMKNIRHSFRRRSEKEPRQHQSENALPVDISIIDSSERTMKLRSCVSQTEYMRIEQLTNERKHNLRNSIRHSTRDVLRHVFHKSHGAYTTEK